MKLCPATLIIEDIKKHLLQALQGDTLTNNFSVTYRKSIRAANKDSVAC